MDIRERIQRSTTTQEKLAQAIGYEPSLFSRIIRGLRPMPPGFGTKVTNMIAQLEIAEEAAQAARAKILEE